MERKANWSRLVVGGCVLLIGMPLLRWACVTGGTIVTVSSVIALLCGMAAYYYYHGFLGHFIKYLTYHPFQASVLVLLYLLCFGLIGSGLGISNVFWADWPFTRILSAATATMTLALLGANAYYLIPEKQHDAIMKKLDDFLDAESLNLPIGRHWEPVRGEVSEISRLQRVARLPFLMLLLLPAALPEAFPYANRFAPIYESDGKKYLWSKFFHLGSNVRSDWWCYAIALIVWLVGILVGVITMKLINYIGSLLAREVELEATANSARKAGLESEEKSGRLGIVADWLTRPQDLALIDPERAIGAKKWLSFYRFSLVIFLVYLFLSLPFVYDGVAVFGWDAAMGTGWQITAWVFAIAGFGFAVSKKTRAPWSLIGIVPLPFLFVALGYQGISASVAICAALGLISVGGLSFVLFVQPRWRLVVGLCLGTVLAVFFGDNRARFDRMDYRDQVSLKEGIFTYYMRRFIAGEKTYVDPPTETFRDEQRTKKRATDREALTRWKSFVLEQERVAKPKLAVVCVTGGASRSAYWSACALDRIERRIPGFDKHIRIIAGASGGMIGTSYYVKELMERRNGRGGPGDGWVEKIPVDSLNQVARYISLRMGFYALSNPLRRLLGWQSYDRGIELEKAWKDIYDLKLDDLHDFEKEGQIPTLIFSPMTVEDGRRLLISNLDLGIGSKALRQGVQNLEPAGRETWPRAIGANVSGQLDSLVDDPVDSFHSLSAVEYSKFYRRPWELRLSTPARMSASFPWVSPAVNLPGNPPLRVVDAGYYDNYGVSVAVSWIYQNREWLLAETSGVVLVQIRDALSYDDRFGYPADDSSELLSAVGKGLQVVTSPLDAALKARETSSMFRNDQEIVLLGKLFETSGKKQGFFTTVVLENAAVASADDELEVVWPGDDLFAKYERLGPGKFRILDPKDQKLKPEELKRLDINSESARAADADAAAGVNVAMTWYLTAAEKTGLHRAIPDPAPDSPWVIGKGKDAMAAQEEAKESRRNRIKFLRELMDAELEPKDEKRWNSDERQRERPYIVRQYGRARNYERLEALAMWWNVDYSK